MTQTLYAHMNKKKKRRAAACVVQWGCPILTGRWEESWHLQPPQEQVVLCHLSLRRSPYDER
jgi:hypothetical protein